MSEYFPFDPAPHGPAFAVPAGATDCQFHVFGPPETYPVRPGAAYQMPRATIAEALRMHAVLGIARGVIVQATTYGTDNSAMLDALAIAGPNYRGCTIGASLLDLDDRAIGLLDAAGVRGARFNFLGAVNLLPDEAAFARAVARAKELGWYIKIQPGQAGILDSVSLYETLDLPVVIDHMGRPDIREGLDGPTVAKVCDLLRRGNVWVLLSNGHKISAEGPPWADAAGIARTYISAAPDRVLWASDWPHPLSKTPPPNDGDLLDLLNRYCDGDKALLRTILSDNPAALFGFPAWSMSGSD
ncbi:amidohydrolase family protein [Shinella sp. G-2]|uniref:amidohydrolase family protein n=1 Tax=Shinella sp. G-2 TaxID=3133141 RepID=UPI003D0096A1